MRPFPSIIMVLPILGFLTVAPAHADHNPANTGSIAVAPNQPTTIYAGTDAGVLKSIDGGATWILASPSSWHIGRVVIDPADPDTVYAWPSDAPGFFKTMDGGQNWAAAGTGEIPVSAPAVIDPANSAIVYAARADGGGLAKSADGGNTWHATGFTLDYVAALAIEPNDSKIVYVGTNWSGIFKSVNGGDTFEPTGAYWNDISPTLALAVGPGQPGPVYAGTGTWCCFGDSTDRGGGGVFRSDDGGATWSSTELTNAPDPFWFSAIQMLAVDRTGVYAVKDSTALVSPDGNTSWRAFRLMEDRYIAVHAIAADSSNSDAPPTIYAASELGVFKSVDGGVSWRASSMPDPAPSTGPVVLTLTSPASDALLTADFDVAWTYTGGAAPIGVKVEARSLDGWSTTPLGTVRPATTPGTLRMHARNMMQGRQLLVVHAWDAAGTGSTVTREITVWYKNETPPDTSIISAVDGHGQPVAAGGVSAATSMTFSVTGSDDEAVSGFECRLDSAAFASCTNPVRYSGLGAGRHDFEVRAVDSAGNRDSTPARHSFTVDTPPDTMLTSAVDNRGKSVANGETTRSDSITLRFTGTDNGTIAGFECRIDSAPFTACTSQTTYTAVTVGTHTFQVRAMDNNGFRDPTPATFMWRRR